MRGLNINPADLFCERAGDQEIFIRKEGSSRVIIRVIPDLTTFWLADYNRDKVLSFESEHELEYSTEAFMRLVIFNCGRRGEKGFQLSHHVMKVFFDRDRPCLSEGAVYESGDPWNTVRTEQYTDSRNNAVWKVEDWRGEGMHGLSGRFYIYEFQGYTFKSNFLL